MAVARLAVSAQPADGATARQNAFTAQWDRFVVALSLTPFVLRGVIVPPLLPAPKLSLDLQRLFQELAFFRPLSWQSSVSLFALGRELQQLLRHACGRHLRLVRSLRVNPDLAHVLMAADGGDVVLAAASFGHPAEERFA